MTGYILRHEAHFRAVMEEQLWLESSEQIRIRRKRLERNENSIAELKRLFIRIYEDNACGRLSDERFDMLSLTYETEQKQLETECVTLRQEIEVQERQNENVEKFIQTAHKYVGIDKLDGYALRNWCPPSMWTHRTNPAGSVCSTFTSITMGWASSR